RLDSPGNRRLDSPGKVYRSVRRYNPARGCIGAKVVVRLKKQGQRHAFKRTYRRCFRTGEMLPGSDPHPGGPLADELRRKVEPSWRGFSLGPPDPRRRFAGGIRGGAVPRWSQLPWRRPRLSAIARPIASKIASDSSRDLRKSLH